MLRLLILSCLAATACTQALKLSKDDSPVVLSHQLITAPNPGERGSLAVKTMFYGSGTDKRRAEFRDSVTLKTKTVDASPFVSMEPPVAKAREKDWGFGVSKFPINGRVWYPDGNGPFPSRSRRSWQSRSARLLRPGLRLPGRAPRVAWIHPRVGR